MPGFDPSTRRGVYQFFRHGVTTIPLPPHLNILLAAEDWSTPPWEIWPNYATRHWWLIQRGELIKERNRAQKDKNN